MKRLTYYLTERQIERLKKESKKTGVSVSEIVRRILDLWLKDQDE